MTTAPDFRSLCAELLDELQYQTSYETNAELQDRARAALATAPPEPPTDDELSDLWTIYDGIVDLRDFVVIARAVIERWGAK